MKDIKCPYCDAGNDVCHDDGQGYDEDVKHEMECHACGKSFVFTTAISLHYSPSKADCLNGAPHDFGEWRDLYTHEGLTEQRRPCKSCDHYERRKVTAKEEQQ